MTRRVGMMALASATVMLTSPKDVGALKYLLLQSIVHLIVILSCSAFVAVAHAVVFEQEGMYTFAKGFLAYMIVTFLGS